MEILSMIVVVSAIVDPWVTTFSFVVALAMRIQGQNPPNLFTFQARITQRFKRVLYTYRTPGFSREERAGCTSFAHAGPTKNGPGGNPGPLL